MKGCKVWQNHILSIFVIQYMDNCAIFRELPLNFIEGELCLFFANFAEKKTSWSKRFWYNLETILIFQVQMNVSTASCVKK